MLRTYAVKLRSDMRIAGIDFPANEQVAAITCEINPTDLLGLVQHHHAIVEEITDAADDDEEQSTLAADPEVQSIGFESNEAEEEQPGDEPEEETTSAEEAISNADAVAAFVTDGLDEKIATALVVANGILGPDALRAKLAEPGFDVIDLEEIGKVRAEKILAIYLK